MRKAYSILSLLAFALVFSSSLWANDETKQGAGSAIARGGNTMKITVNGTVLTAALTKSSTTRELEKMLAKGPVTIAMQDYGNMEKVGMLPSELPRNDQSISTEAGDLILYNGRAFVIYYDRNSWNFTRIGKIENVDAASLKKLLGPGSVSVTLSLD